MQQEKETIFNGKDLSNWNFVVGNDAVPADQVSLWMKANIHQGEPIGYMYTKYANYTRNWVAGRTGEQQRNLRAD